MTETPKIAQSWSPMSCSRARTMTEPFWGGSDGGDTRPERLHSVRLTGLVLALLSPPARAGAAEYCGYDQGGSHFAPLGQITPGNVDQLVPAWTYHTGDLKSRAPDVLKGSKFEVTPILVGNTLVACTPFNAVVALDPGTGQELWRYDPEIKTDYRPANMFACRGVAVCAVPAARPGGAPSGS
jgi:quinoprotein glucose dehydrogenase